MPHIEDYEKRKKILEEAGITYNEIAEDLAFHMGFQNSGTIDDAVLKILNSKEFIKILRGEIIKQAFSVLHCEINMKDSFKSQIDRFLNADDWEEEKISNG